MAVTTDIVATYRGPAAVIRKLLAQGPREDRALVYVMAGCLIVFVAQLPVTAPDMAHGWRCSGRFWPLAR